MLSLAEIQKTTVALLGGLRFFATFCCRLFSDNLEILRYFSLAKLLRAHRKLSYFCGLGYQ